MVRVGVTVMFRPGYAVLDRPNLDHLLHGVQTWGNEIVDPTIDSGAIAYDVIQSASVSL